MNRLKSLILVCFLLLFCTACEGQAAAPGMDSVQAEPLEAGVAPPVEEPPAEPEEEPEPEPEEPYIRVIDPSKPMVALTFDDGPAGTYSDQILDILEENHALATFFEVGGNVWAYPKTVARMAEIGCEVASHSNAHKNLSKMRKSTLLADLDAADEAFIAAGVDAPFLVRPPYGAVNNIVKSATGRAMVTWTVDTEDWRSRDAQTVIDYVKNYGGLDGEIILMHSIYSSTVEATRELVPWLQEQGYQLVTITELMAFYYGELPEANHFYGYTYFTTHGRTDTPIELPSMFPPEEADMPEEDLVVPEGDLVVPEEEADIPEEDAVPVLPPEEMTLAAAPAPEADSIKPEADPIKEPEPVKEAEPAGAAKIDARPVSQLSQQSAVNREYTVNPGVPNPAVFHP